MKLPEDISSKIPQAKIVILLGRNKSRHDEVRLVSLMNELSCIVQILLNTITGGLRGIWYTATQKRRWDETASWSVLCSKLWWYWHWRLEWQDHKTAIQHSSQKKSIQQMLWKMPEEILPTDTLLGSRDTRFAHLSCTTIKGQVYVILRYYACCICSIS